MHGTRIMEAMWRWRKRWRTWLAGRPGRRGDRAREEMAALWFRTRDPTLRAVVVQTGAVAAPYPRFQPKRSGGSAAWYMADWPMMPHLATLALHGRLAEAEPLGVARGLRGLLDDPDPEVAAAACEFVRAASGPVLTMLWQGAAHIPRVRELLLANPRPVPDDALDVAWSLWLSAPDRRLWERLAGRPAANRRLSHIVLGLATPAETCAAALSGGTSDLVVSYAVAVCRDRGYAPDDPADRAALFVLTGQAERYTAIDAESVLLARAYRRAPQRLRRRLRAAMTEIEGIDLVRVLTGGGRGRRALTAVERDYLARQLAARGDP